MTDHRTNDNSPDDLLAEIFLTESDGLRFVRVLSMLSKHLVEPAIVTGSFAVEWHLRTKHGEARKRRLNDIDLVAENGMSDIGPGLPSDFLIHHFHPTRESGNVMIQLVEPQTRTRVDIFTPRSSSVGERVSNVNIDGTYCEVAAAEDLTARLLAIVGIALEGRTIDPKHFDSISRLMAVTDLGVAATLWSEYRRGNEPVDFYEAFKAVKLAVSRRPDLFKPEEYSQDIDAGCPWCVESPDFPLAPRSQIFQILGYV